MTAQQFIDALHAIGWRGVGDAQHTHIEKLWAHMCNKGDAIVTCVYCGHQYPAGTPPSGSELLTAHIKVCEKHPLRAAEKRIEQYREALSHIGLADDVEEAWELAREALEEQP
jgi:hypothetical protein